MQSLPEWKNVVPTEVDLLSKDCFIYTNKDTGFVLNFNPFRHLKAKMAGFLALSSKLVPLRHAFEVRLSLPNACEHLLEDRFRLPLRVFCFK